MVTEPINNPMIKIPKFISGFLFTVSLVTINWILGYCELHFLFTILCPAMLPAVGVLVLLTGPYRRSAFVQCIAFFDKYKDTLIRLAVGAPFVGLIASLGFALPDTKDVSLIEILPWNLDPHVLLVVMLLFAAVSGAYIVITVIVTTLWGDKWPKLHSVGSAFSLVCALMLIIYLLVIVGVIGEIVFSP